MSFIQEFIRSFAFKSDGFVFMYIILGIGLFAIAIVIERVIYISSRSNIDGVLFTKTIREYLRNKEINKALQLCASAGELILPKVIGAAIGKSQTCPAQIRATIEENVIGGIARLERRLSYVIMCANVSTLLGLMGTIYGLILSFEAVGQPGVEPAMKASLLASGISTAMNTTLMGLIIAVPSLFAYSTLRSKLDSVTAEVDKYSTNIMKMLIPKGAIQKGYNPSSRRSGEEIDSEPNIIPMMSLMTVLIPLLLSSTEFVKLGNIQINLPTGGGVSTNGGSVKRERNLNLGLIITPKGIDVKSEFEKRMKSYRTGGKKDPAIVIKNNKQDVKALNKYLAEVKRLALYEIVRNYKPNISPNTSLLKLAAVYSNINKSSLPVFKDNESIKILAESKVKYKTIIAIMDAARTTSKSGRKIDMFTNVSMAGGVI